MKIQGLNMVGMGTKDGGQRNPEPIEAATMCMLRRLLLWVWLVANGIVPLGCSRTGDSSAPDKSRERDGKKILLPVIEPMGHERGWVESLSYAPDGKSVVWWHSS